jgi:hypothetical protein
MLGLGLAILTLIFALWVIQLIVVAMGWENSPLVKPLFILNKGRRGSTFIGKRFFLSLIMMFIISLFFLVATPASAYSGTAGSTGNIIINQSQLGGFGTYIQITNLEDNTDYIIVTDDGDFGAGGNLSFTASGSTFQYTYSFAIQDDENVQLDLWGYNSTDGSSWLSGNEAIIDSVQLIQQRAADLAGEEGAQDLLPTIITVGVIGLLAVSFIGFVTFQSIRSGRKGG